MNIKRALTAAAAFASAVILAGAMATPVMAQMVSAPNLNGNPNVNLNNNPNTHFGKHHAYTERFDSYLDGNPDVAQQLHQNPKLIDNPHYLKAHPSLRNYLHKHPNVAQTYKSHPNKFMHRENKYQKSEQHWDNRHGEPGAANYRRHNWEHHHDKDWNQHHGEAGVHYQEHHEHHHDQGWNHHHDQPGKTN